VLESFPNCLFPDIDIYSTKTDFHSARVELLYAGTPSDKNIVRARANIHDPPFS
jgi:hypothetical protein